MNNTDIIEKIKIGIEMLDSNDDWLLKKDLSEQSITHKLAEYLQTLFIGYNVDCEYNGNIKNESGLKRISVLKSELEEKGLLKDKEIIDNETEFTERRVFPDIIIHKRGTNNDNLCIIEVKKSTSSVSSDYDKIKLKCYTTDGYENDLKYKIGLFIEFVTGTAERNYYIKYFINGSETSE